MSKHIVGRKTNGKYCGDCLSCCSEYDNCDMYKLGLEIKWLRGETVKKYVRCQECLDSEVKFTTCDNCGRQVDKTETKGDWCITCLSKYHHEG